MKRNVGGVEKRTTPACRTASEYSRKFCAAFGRGTLLGSVGILFFQHNQKTRMAAARSKGRDSCAHTVCPGKDGMDSESFVSLLKIVYLVFAYLLLRRLRNYQQGGWAEKPRQIAAKVAKDESLRHAELADIDAKLAALPRAEPVEPVPVRLESKMRILPSMMMAFAIVGLMMTFLALFHAGETVPVFKTIPGGSMGRMLLALGVFMIAMTAPLYFWSERTRQSLGRAYQLARKYYIYRAGKDPARFETLREIMEYYPETASLWLELADQQAESGEYEEAVRSARKGGEIAPKSVEYLIAEASYQIRREKWKSAEKTVARAAEMRLGRSDPRVEIYGAAVLLGQGRDEEAVTLVQDGKKKDWRSVKRYLMMDPALRDLKAFLDAKKRK